MAHRLLRTAVVTVLALVIPSAGSARADDGSTTTTPPSTTVVLVPTTIADDNYTLFPDWSDDNFGYLDPPAGPPSMPSTGKDLSGLAGLSAVAIVAGAGLSAGARSRARRR